VIQGDMKTSSHQSRVRTFDKGRSRSINPAANNGMMTGHPCVFGVFQERHRRPAREVVTGKLLGDPAPDRPRPQKLESIPGRISTESGPVLLTFRELDASRA